MYERRIERLAPPDVYRRRLLTSGSVGLGLIVVSLAVGIAGYAGFEGLSFVDAFLNAAMILSGMGPLYGPQTTGGKLFAGFYALYSGLAVLIIAAVMFAPVLHRVLHRFHLEQRDEDEKARKKSPPTR
jgi:multisubunit Na+/H+ antiporter MnhG subunit